jgi:hypothetical protein
MKIERGDYEGASRFAYFETDLDSMSRDQMKRLLECIAHRADPGETNCLVMYQELALAETVYLEWDGGETLGRCSAQSEVR